MINNTIPQEYDGIYLQVNLEEWDSIEYEWNGVTWCSDLIYDDDVKYLLATPEREAAPEMLEALEKIGAIDSRPRSSAVKKR